MPDDLVQLNLVIKMHVDKIPGVDEDKLHNDPMLKEEVNEVFARMHKRERKVHGTARLPSPRLGNTAPDVRAEITECPRQELFLLLDSVVVSSLHQQQDHL